MDEYNWDESRQRVHPGRYTIFPPGEQQCKQQIVNNGRRRESGEILPARSNGLAGCAGETLQGTFRAKGDANSVKMFDDGKRIIDFFFGDSYSWLHNVVVFIMGFNLVFI